MVTTKKILSNRHLAHVLLTSEVSTYTFRKYHIAKFCQKTHSSFFFCVCDEKTCSSLRWKGKRRMCPQTICIWMKKKITHLQTHWKDIASKFKLMSKNLLRNVTAKKLLSKVWQSLFKQSSFSKIALCEALIQLARQKELAVSPTFHS